MNKTPTATCDHGVPLTDDCPACAARLRGAAVCDDRGLVTGFDFSPTKRQAIPVADDEPARIEATIEIDEGGYEPRRYRATLRPVPFHVAMVDVDEWVEADAGASWLRIGSGDWTGEGIDDFTRAPLAERISPEAIEQLGGALAEAVRKAAS